MDRRRSMITVLLSGICTGLLDKPVPSFDGERSIHAARRCSSVGRPRNSDKASRGSRRGWRGGMIRRGWRRRRERGVDAVQEMEGQQQERFLERSRGGSDPGIERGSGRCATDNPGHARAEDLHRVRDAQAGSLPTYQAARSSSTRSRTWFQSSLPLRRFCSRS
jgi:hypothetical protein